MGYVRTAGMSTAARRARRRAALVITAVLAVLTLIFALSFATVRGWVTWPGGDAQPTAVTVPEPEVDLVAADVTVNVYNTTDVAGLAGRAGEALQARDFNVGAIANDPEGAEIEGVAVIRHGTRGETAAGVLADTLPEGVELTEDDRSDGTVDLVLGDKWEDLPAPDEDDG